MSYISPGIYEKILYKEDRKKYFVKKNSEDGKEDACLYLYDNSSEKHKECVIINDYLIKSDAEWMKKQNTKSVDLEAACAYYEELSERLYPALVQFEQWERLKSKLCHEKIRKKHPECAYSSDDSEEMKREKEDARVRYFNSCLKEINEKITEALTVEGVDMNVLCQDIPYDFFKQNMLYNAARGENQYPPDFKKDNKKIKEVFKEFVEKIYGKEDTASFCREAEEQNVARKNKTKKLSYAEAILEKELAICQQEVEQQEVQLREQAKKQAFHMIFRVKKWDVETWIELIFRNFYNRTENAKPQKNVQRNERRKWLKGQCFKWFREDGNDYTWRFSYTALESLSGVVDKDKREDLLNYSISLDKLRFPEIHWIISKGHEKKSTIEHENGLPASGLVKRLQQKDVHDFDPFLACALWQKSNLAFERLFQIREVKFSWQEKQVRDSYIKKKKIWESQKLIPAFEMDRENPEKNDFWYSPVADKRPISICIEIYSQEKVRFTIEYGSFLTEPITIELPYSAAMYKIVKMEPEKALEIVKDAGFETIFGYLQFCGEMMVRKYCETFFGISYTTFQNIKRHAQIFVFIKPLILQKPDGKVVVEFLAQFEKNKGMRNIKRDLVSSLSGYTWENRESLQKDWDLVKESIEAATVKECRQWNGEMKEFSEFTMEQEGFFEYLYDEAEEIRDSACEKTVILWDFGKRFRMQ